MKTVMQAGTKRREGMIQESCVGGRLVCLYHTPLRRGQEICYRKGGEMFDAPKVLFAAKECRISEGKASVEEKLNRSHDPSREKTRNVSFTQEQFVLGKSSG
mmetsp:Transcript_4136/g.15575  ORF Transcript_4136/g.15575 Transcript_4136/m.15575 type:complete len:102 (+) Transcript_4136:4294-4599(+)